MLRHPDELFILHSNPTRIYDCLRIVRIDGTGYMDMNQISTGSALRHIADPPEEYPDELWLGLLDEWIDTCRGRILRFAFQLADP